MQQNAIVRNLSGMESLDRIGSPLQSAVDGALAKVPVVRKTLQGTSWLGHALHPALTDFPIGAWAAGFVLDMIEVGGGKLRHRDAADIVHLFGFGSACLAGITGLAEYADAREPEQKRVGVVHGLLNVGILGLYGASLLVRRNGRRRQGIVLASIGFGCLLASGWLGRELSYTFGMGQSKGRRMPRVQEPVLSQEVRDEGQLEVPTAVPSDLGNVPVTH